MKGKGKPLPEKDVRVRADRTGPARLTAIELKALESVTDENLRRTLGEILLRSRGVQRNFEAIEGWFPLQPGDVTADLRNTGQENEKESDEGHFWLRWLRKATTEVVESIRGYISGTQHILRLKTQAKPNDATHGSYIDIYAYDEDKRTGVFVVAGGNSAYVLRKNEDGTVFSSFVMRNEFFAKGDLLSASAESTPKRLAVGTDGKVLVADSTATTGLKWKTVEEAGLKGLEGRWAGLHYTWLTNTENSDPGAGKAKRDAGSTTLRLSETDKDGNGIAAFLATWDDSTTLTNRGTIIIRQVGSPKRFRIYKVTGANEDAGTYDNITVGLIAEGEALQNEAEVVIEWLRTGDEGAAGAEGKEGKEGPEGKAGATGASALSALVATTKALPANTRTGNILKANANGEIGLIDGEVVTFEDVILVKDEATGANNGLYKLIAAPIGGKWELERIASYDSTAEVNAGMLITVRAGTVNGDKVFVQTVDGATINVTALVFRALCPRDFGLVSALPSGASKGDTCLYQAEGLMTEQNIIWELVYNGTNWTKIGGSPLYAASNTGRELINKTAYTSLPTDPLSIKVPLKGTYDITVESLVNQGAAGNECWHSYAIGATAASDTWAGKALAQGAANGDEVMKTTRQSAVAASAEIIEKGRTGGATAAVWRNRRLYVDPVTVE